MILIKTQRDKLLLPLQSVSGIVEKKHTLPILSNVLLEKHTNNLTFLATDIEIQVTTSSEEPESETTGTLTVAAKKFQDILRSLPEKAEVSLSLEDRRLIIRSGKSRFNLQTLPAADFPRLSISENASKQITLTQKKFRQLLAETQFAMAVQDVRYYLNGLLLLLEGNELRAVATDGHRLAYSSMTLDTEEDAPRQEFVLPRKTVIELSRLLSDSEDPLKIDLSSNQVRFRFANIDLISKLIDGKFPDYQRVIPQTLANMLVLNRASFLQSLMRAAILTNEKLRGIRFILSPGSLKIMAANTEQEDSQEEIEVTYSGEVMDVGFNISYLFDILNNMNSENFEWCFNDASSSVLFKLPNNENFKYVVMPMRI